MSVRLFVLNLNAYKYKEGVETNFKEKQQNTQQLYESLFLAKCTPAYVRRGRVDAVDVPGFFSDKSDASLLDLSRRYTTL